jgi:hypothetical protein
MCIALNKPLSTLNHYARITLGKKYLCLLEEAFITISESSEITKFWVTIAANFRALTQCMNVNYVAGHERARIFCF